MDDGVKPLVVRRMDESVPSYGLPSAAFPTLYAVGMGHAVEAVDRKRPRCW